MHIRKSATNENRKSPPFHTIHHKCISHASFCPIAPVEIPVAHSLGDVGKLYLLAACQVCDGACHLEDAAVGTGGERQTLHGHAEHFQGGGIGFGIFVKHAFGHLGIAVDALDMGVALRLNLAGGNHSLADGGAGLTWLCLREIFERNGGYLALDVNTIGYYVVHFSF